MEEPYTPTPRPCSTPHSAPAVWLRDEPGTEPAEPRPLTPEQQRREAVDRFLETYESIAPDGTRRDGWTPFLRKLFLRTVAETGLVSAACEFTGMSRTAAYDLLHRDRVFAAGWAAAAHFARGPIADGLSEKGINGITETVTRSDGVTVTRHRFDGRLSMAVLNRLDKRCDRAEEQGSAHLAAVRNWDAFLGLVGKGDDAAAEALLDGAKECSPCQLPERAFPIPVGDPPRLAPSDNVWKDGDGRWMTCFPPPPGFDGWQNVAWDGFTHYERVCTADEAELLDTNDAVAEAEEAAEETAYAEAMRDKFFAGLLRDPARAGAAPTAEPCRIDPSIPPPPFRQLERQPARRAALCDPMGAAVRGGDRRLYAHAVHRRSDQSLARLPSVGAAPGQRHFHGQCHSVLRRNVEHHPEARARHRRARVRHRDRLLRDADDGRRARHLLALVPEGTFRLGRA